MKIKPHLPSHNIFECICCICEDTRKTYSNTLGLALTGIKNGKEMPKITTKRQAIDFMREKSRENAILYKVKSIK